MDVTGINPQPSVAGVHREDADIGGDIQIRQLASASDGVSISEQAEQVKKAMRAAQDSPDPRSEQVIRLKQAISNGTYHISAQSLAVALIAYWTGTRW
ncbi:MAG: flagellar biosynthesis anti-sigma factor FlgM [Chloroflexota bacterium]|jgi:flagellar biosynthesis anti-sigma factor FlgM